MNTPLPARDAIEQTRPLIQNTAQLPAAYPRVRERQRVQEAEGIEKKPGIALALGPQRQHSLALVTLRVTVNRHPDHVPHITYPLSWSILWACAMPWLPFP